MSNAAESPYLADNPLSETIYFSDGQHISSSKTDIVRANETTAPFIAITNVFEHIGMATRSVARKMIERSLAAVEPTVFGSEELSSHSLRVSTKLERVEEFEVATFSEDVEDPRFEIRALIARDQIRGLVSRDHTVTVFDGEHPLLHAGFRNSHMGDHDTTGLADDDGGWFGEDASEENRHYPPSIGFIIGDRGRLNGERGEDAISALFTLLESRQRFHKGYLTRYHAGEGPLGPYTESDFNSCTFGTVPWDEFSVALNALAASQLAED